MGEELENRIAYARKELAHLAARLYESACEEKIDIPGLRKRLFGADAYELVHVLEHDETVMSLWSRFADTLIEMHVVRGQSGKAGSDSNAANVHARKEGEEVLKKLIEHLRV